jgi:hypothetical protein
VLPVAKVMGAWTLEDRAMVLAVAKANTVCQWEEETMDLKEVAWTIWVGGTEEVLVEAIPILIRMLTVAEDLISAATTTANLMVGPKVTVQVSSEVMVIKALHQ